MDHAKDLSALEQVFVLKFLTWSVLVFVISTCI